MAPVVVAGPLMNTHPLFALLWARHFLSQLERITFRLVLGTILVFVSVTLIAAPTSLCFIQDLTLIVIIKNLVIFLLWHGFCCKKFHDTMIYVKNS